MSSQNALEIGDRVSNFLLIDHMEKKFELNDHKGQQILLSFHPLAWTSICAQQMKAMEKHYDQFLNLNTLSVGLSVDSVPSKSAWAEKLGLKRLRLLSDFWPHGGLAQTLGIFRNKRGFSERANFILDKDGKIIFKKIYDISELPDIDELMAFLKQ